MQPFDPIEKKAFLISVIFLILGLLIIRVSKSFLLIDSDILMISMAFIPAIIYTIFSGRLKELKGPGGIEAKFAETASEKISISSKMIELSHNEIQDINKGSTDDLIRKIDDIDDTKPIIMSITIGDRNYVKDDLDRHLKLLSEFRYFKYILFVDSNKRFIGYMQKDYLKTLIKSDLIGNFIKVISQSQSNKLIRYPGVLRDTFSLQTTNIEALRVMTKNNMDDMFVIDNNHKIKGIVNREHLVARIIVNLI